MHASRSHRLRRCVPAVLVACLSASAEPTASAAKGPILRPMSGQAEMGFIEIHGVGAGEFAPNIWRAGSLHWVPDVRTPLIAPRVSGVFRNIYAPSIVEEPGGWRVFYGAWDGVPTGNDRIYSLRTRDFLDFGERSTVIEHGAFVHVCNVSALRFEDGSYHLICTAYPDARDRNKPSAFHSPDGNVWNGSPAPYAAKMSDIVEMADYPKYEDADINGVNVVLHDDGLYRLFFCNWRDPGQVYRASGKDGKRFRLDGVCLKSGHGVNDVKKLTVDGRPQYLMALHMNTDRLWYSLSNDGMHFEPERELAGRLDDRDRYIVAVGWVVGGRRVLGFLYGAGAAPTLDRNRLFARWLQKKVVFITDQGKRLEPSRSLGPDRQLIPLGGEKELAGHVEIFSEDGQTPLGPASSCKIVSGCVYRLQ